MSFNINDLDLSDPYRRRHDFSVKSDHHAHDTRSAALGFDFCENPSLFRKPALKPKIVPTSSFWAPKTWRPKFNPALEPTAQLARQKLKEISE
jgi:hypothetical protein